LHQEEQPETARYNSSHTYQDEDVDLDMLAGFPELFYQMHGRVTERYHIHRILPRDFQFAEMLHVRKNEEFLYIRMVHHERTSARESRPGGRFCMPTESVPELRQI